MQPIELGIVRSKPGVALVVLVFLAMLSWPIPGLLFWRSTEAAIVSQEQRNPNLFPDRPATPEELAKWPQQFEAWINDRLLLRTSLVLANTYIQLKVLGQSTSSRVVLGKDGWLFYTGDKSIEQALGSVRFTAAELDRWIDVMERRQAWLAGRSIPFLVVVVPNKERIYREYLPNQPKTANPISHLEQLKQRLAERSSSLNLLDLTPGLWAAKSSIQTHLKSDTHWTGQAAFLFGYVPVMERLRSMRINVKPLSVNDVRVSIQRRLDGDLAALLGAPSLYGEDIADMPFLGPGHLTTVEHRRDDGVRTAVIRSSLTDTPKAFWIHDSYSVPLLKYLHETFRETIVTEHGNMRFNRRLVEAEKPDFVVYEFVERYLSYLIPPE
jgi:alginate O-acetyltransferase complex protein AlgJ